MDTILNAGLVQRALIKESIEVWRCGPVTPELCFPELRKNMVLIQFQKKSPRHS